MLSDQVKEYCDRELMRGKWLAKRKKRRLLCAKFFGVLRIAWAVPLLFFPAIVLVFAETFRNTFNKHYSWHVRTADWLHHPHTRYFDKLKAWRDADY